MTQRKKLEGALAGWHPHPKAEPASPPKSAPSSLIPVVRDTAARDELADSFFTSVPREYAPEPPLTPDTTTRRAVIDSAAVRARRRYLMRYVAGAVSMASLIGLAAVVRVTTARDASAADRIARGPSAITSLIAAATESLPHSAATQAMTATATEGFPPAVVAEPIAPQPAAAEPVAPETTAVEPVAPQAVAVEPVAPQPTATEPVAAPTAAPAADVPAPTEATASPATDSSSERDPKAAGHAKRTAQRALDRGHLREAIEAGEQSVSLDPTDADAWLILGGAYESRGAYSEARRCFKRCSRLAKRGSLSECRALLR